jgi:hypothetical protein
MYIFTLSKIDDPSLISAYFGLNNRGCHCEECLSIILLFSGVTSLVIFSRLVHVECERFLYSAPTRTHACVQPISIV